MSLVAHLAKAGVDAIVLEIADGVLQRETAALLDSETFREASRAVMLTAGDAMGAAAGVRWLRDHGLDPIGLAGVLTAAPLQRDEAVAATGLPTWSREDLIVHAREILDRVAASHEGRAWLGASGARGSDGDGGR